MADLPLSFSAPMVAALLAGTKTQTRRTMNPQPQGHVWRHGWEHDNGATWSDDAGSHKLHIWAGDRLYVRESYYQLGHWEPVEGKFSKGGRQKWAFTPDADKILYDAPSGETVRLGRHHKDPSTVAWHKRLGRFMPKQYSRLTLIVTDVRVERLQAISEEDALAEGITPHPSGLGYWVPGVEHPDPNFPWLSRTTPREMYAALWDTINGSGEWGKDPWIVAQTFTVHHGNIDEI